MLFNTWVVVWLSSLWVTQGLIDKPSRWFSWPDEIFTLVTDGNFGFYMFALVRVGIEKGLQRAIIVAAL